MKLNTNFSKLADSYLFIDIARRVAAYREQNPEADFVTAASMAMEVQVQSKDPYTFKTKDIYPARCNRMDEFLLCQSCPMPIQSMLFRRHMFEQYGGLTEAPEGDEDGSMWRTYFSVGKHIHSACVDIPRATSLFLVPANPAAAKEREEAYRRYEDAMPDDKTN